MRRPGSFTAVATEGNTSIEQLDDTIRTAQESTKHLQDWIIKSRKPFIEKNINGDLYIAVSRTLSDGCNYGIILKAGPNGNKLNSMDVNNSAHSNASGLPSNVDKFSVFTHNIEVVEGEKNVIPSFIGLQCFNLPTFRIGESSYKWSPLVNTRSEFGSIPGYGEVDILFPKNGRHDRLMTTKKSRGEHIEAASNTVDNNSNFGIDNGVWFSDIAELSRGAPKPARAGRFKTGQCADAFYTSSVPSVATFP